MIIRGNHIIVTSLNSFSNIAPVTTRNNTFCDKKNVAKGQKILQKVFATKSKSLQKTLDKCQSENIFNDVFLESVTNLQRNLKSVANLQHKLKFVAQTCKEICNSLQTFKL